MVISKSLLANKKCLLPDYKGDIIMKKYMMLLIGILMLTLVGCNTNGSNEKVNNESIELETEQESTQIEVEEDIISGLVMNTEEVVYFEEDYMRNLGEGQSFSDGEEIIITQSGTYEFTGEYSNSTITVNVDKNTDEDIVYLVLKNTTITSESATPINIIEAKNVVIVLEGENTVVQEEITVEDEEFPTAAIYSKADMVITGTGSLSVTTSYNDGINSRDDLIVEDVTIKVNAVGDGIVGKDLLVFSDSEVSVVAGKDGLKTSNAEEINKGNLLITSGNFIINAQNDGISSEQILQINGGTFNITSGGGFVEVLNEITQGEGSGNVVHATDLLEESMKGLKGLNLILNDGEFAISSYEDSIHADYDLIINDGVYKIRSGDDAFHAENELIINDIDLIVENAYEGIEGSMITINGGNITINVLDDAINAGSEVGFIKITDGAISLTAQGDGIDSNNDLIIEGGEIIIDVDARYTGGDSELDVTGVYTISAGSVVDESGNEVSPVTQKPNTGGGRGQGTTGGRR